MSSLYTIIDTTDSIATSISASGSYFVKRTYDGTGDAGTITISSNNVDIILDVACAVAQKFIFSGNNIGLFIFPKASFDDIDSTGTGNKLIVFNGCTGGVVKQITSGSAYAIKGYGLGSTLEHIEFDRIKCIVESISIDSKTPGAGLDAIKFSSSAQRCKATMVRVANSDEDAFNFVGTNNKAFGSTVVNADNRGFDLDSAKNTISCNHVLSSTATAIQISTNGDDNVVTANYLNDAGSLPILVDSGASRNVIAANQLKSGITDSGSNTTDVDNVKPSSGFSNLVAASGGDYSTITSAIGDNLKEFKVKGGATYTENLVLDEACQRIVFGPGTTVSGDVDFSSSSNVILELKSGCTITGDITITSSSGCGIIAKNGFSLHGQIIAANGNSNDFFMDLGGYDSLISDRIQASSENMLLKHYSHDTKGGDSGDTGSDAYLVGSDGDYVTISSVNMINTSDEGILKSNSAGDSMFNLLFIGGHDSRAIEAQGLRNIISGCNIEGGGSAGIDSDGAGDDSVWVANVVDDTVSNASGDDDQLIYGNKIDTTLTDNSGNSTVAANNLTAF